MSDLSNLTLDLFRGSLTREVIHKIPMLAMLWDHRRITRKGGTQISDVVVRSTSATRTQAYRPGAKLNVSDISRTTKVTFNHKYTQTPIKITCDEETQNELATSEVKRADLTKLKVRESQEDHRQYLNKAIHATTAAGDSGADIQGVVEAAGHSRTYGEQTSDTTFSSMGWWGGASLGDIFTDMATAMAVSMSNLRKCIYRCRRYVPEGDPLYLFVCEDLHSKIAANAESMGVYQAGTEQNSRMFKYGFKTFKVDGDVEVVKDTWMQLNSMTGYAIFMNPNTFEFALHPQRALQVTPFVRQDQMENGEDALLARIKLMGNVICWQPNGNMVKSNAS